MEFLTPLLLVVAVCCHCHNAVEFNALHLLPFAAFDELATFFYGEAELRFLLSYMELQENGDSAVALHALLVDFANKLYGVSRMDEAHERRDVLHFVRLQMTNEVPFDVLWQCSFLANKFLHMAFAKNSLSGIVRLLQLFLWMVFTNGTKGYTLSERSLYAV